MFAVVGATILPLFLIPFGRVTMFTSGLLVQALSYLGMMISTCFEIKKLIPPMYFFFELGFNLSVGGVTIVYIVEILPYQLAPLTCALCWASKMLIGYSALHIIQTFGIFPLYASFFTFSLLGMFFLYGFAVETRNKTSSQMFREFQIKTFLDL